MPKLFIFDAFTLLIREKTVANYALLRCKTFSLKIWVCKIFDKFHVCLQCGQPINRSLSAKMKGKWQGSTGFLAGQDLNGPPDIVRVPSKASHIQLENMLSRISE